jgi:hypothetical protein
MPAGKYRSALETPDLIMSFMTEAESERWFYTQNGAETRALGMDRREYVI